MRKALRWVYFIAGAACVAYFFIIWHASRLGLSFCWIWPLFGAAFLAAGALCGEEDGAASQRHRLRVPRWARWTWRGLLCACLIAFIALEGLVISGMRAAPPANLDYLIVLGARVDPDGPSPALNRRLNAVMAILPDYPDAVIVASGGQGSDEPISEAQCIRDELVRRGVSPSRILMEDRSTTTAENLNFSRALIARREGLEGGDILREVGVVTNNYHVWRAQRIARQAGLPRAHGIAAEYTGHTLFHYMVREAICIAADWLRGNLG